MFMIYHHHSQGDHFIILFNTRKYSVCYRQQSIIIFEIKI